MQGPGGSLGKEHGALVPGMVHALRKGAPLSLVLGAGQVAGGFSQGRGGSKSSLQSGPWLSASSVNWILHLLAHPPLQGSCFCLLTALSL